MSRDSQKRVAVTGASGASGRALCALLSKDPSVMLVTINRQDFNNLSSCLDGVEEIYHCAGSHTENFDTDFATNVAATKQVIDAASQAGKARILLIGSAAEYGTPEHNPVQESHPLRPISLYGLTKVYQHELMHWYVRRDIDLVMARTFNLYGPGISSSLFPGRIEQEVARYKNGEISHIETGALNAVRDYLSVEEAAIHYKTIMHKGVRGEVYNVGSGKGVQMREFLKTLLAQRGLSIDIIKEAPPGDKGGGVSEIYADISKLSKL